MGLDEWKVEKDKKKGNEKMKEKEEKKKKEKEIFVRSTLARQANISKTDREKEYSRKTMLYELTRLGKTVQILKSKILLFPPYYVITVLTEGE
uniref:Uncharacterized protein n=1 Tax=Vespula pensylvanica TaxID=30213 RepID=A0A834U4D6_VESPE|nr:hypothetical protein H0235_011070 [Vespula pensylvanica]